MKILRHTGRAIFFVFSCMILLCLLIGGGISMWHGISTQDQGLIMVSLIMVSCAFLGGVILLQVLMPRLNIVSPQALPAIFWILLGIPVCGSEAEKRDERCMKSGKNGW
jgi:hypothetical protein